MEPSAHPCPLCGRPGAESLYEFPDRAVLACPRCGLRYSSRPYSTAQSRSFYDSEEFWRGPLVRRWTPGFDPASPEVKLFRLGLGWLRQAGLRGRMLDVGCSRGLFLRLAQREGWQPHGVEISPRAVEAAREHFALEVFCGTLKEAHFETGLFDAVTLWDALEHFEDPRGTLAEVARITRPGGGLLLLTPDCSSLFHTLGHWAHRAVGRRALGILQLLYPDKHSTYFTPQSLGRMLSQVGFRPVARRGFPTFPGRWLRARVSPALWAAVHLIDAASGPLGRRYRMLVLARRQQGAAAP